VKKPACLTGKVGREQARNHKFWVGGLYICIPNPNGRNSLHQRIDFWF